MGELQRGDQRALEGAAQGEDGDVKMMVVTPEDYLL